MKREEISIFWFRRDLRLRDNAGLYAALRSGRQVVPLFIFDKQILDKLDDSQDSRVQFIHQELMAMRKELKELGSDLEVRYGNPEAIWEQLLVDYDIEGVFTNRDYEPYARKRDEQIEKLLASNKIVFQSFKDQVIFECADVVKDNGEPYVVYTPFSKKWLELYKPEMSEPFESQKYFDQFAAFHAKSLPPTLKEMGFESFEFEYPSRDIDKKVIKAYSEKRNFPAQPGTSRLSMHLRFGTVSIRHLTKIAQETSKSWLNELIWRNFYQVIIWYFPDRIENAFKPAYDQIEWLNDEQHFKAWCNGKTGYPIVDAGMRELNETGFMHNRVRMITASFLSKHLLVDWRWGEAYFAKKLIDFELASNNGGWQWAASTGCDAAPYFRVFNPTLQTEKFDPDLKYVKRWVPEYGTSKYPEPIVEHKMARQRAIDTYKAGLEKRK